MNSKQLNNLKVHTKGERRGGEGVGQSQCYASWFIPEHSCNVIVAKNIPSE